MSILVLLLANSLFVWAISICRRTVNHQLRLRSKWPKFVLIHDFHALASTMTLPLWFWIVQLENPNSLFQFVYQNQVLFHRKNDWQVIRCMQKSWFIQKYSYAHIINVLKVVEPVSSDGAQRIMEEKNQQFNEKPNFRFGEMKTAIEHIINQLPIISYALVTVKVKSYANYAIPFQYKIMLADSFFIFLSILFFFFSGGVDACQGIFEMKIWLKFDENCLLSWKTKIKISF